MKLALQILALIVAAGTFLPLIRSDAWWIRGWDFPRIQLFLVGTLLLAILVMIGTWQSPWDRIVFACLGFALVALVSWMSKYTPFRSVTVHDGQGEADLKFLISNVLKSNRRTDGLLAMVREHQPDLIIALETDSYWAQQIASLAADYPHAVELPQNDTYGMVLRSRIPLLNLRVERLIRKNIPSVHCDLPLADGTLVHLHAVHPKPPFPDEDTSSADRDAELLLVAREVKDAGGPAIVLGDLNDVAWSRTTKLFQKTSGLLDPRMGRGFFNTFHAAHWWMRWPLDHVFTSVHFRVTHLQRQKLEGSDHFAIIAGFTFKPENRDQQEAPAISSAEREEVDEKIAKPQMTMKIRGL
jgi:endonuclease/exonuclease/phosphatase (EEP) superfamily protein YafD